MELNDGLNAQEIRHDRRKEMSQIGRHLSCDESSICTPCVSVCVPGQLPEAAINHINISEPLPRIVHDLPVRFF